MARRLQRLRTAAQAKALAHLLRVQLLQYLEDTLVF